MVSALLLRRVGEHGLFPEVGSQVAIVLEMTSKMALAKLPREALQPLADGSQAAVPTISSSCTGASGGRDETHRHRATAACHLAWNSVGLATLVP